MRKIAMILSTLGLLSIPLFLNSSVFASDIEWSGTYRIEGNVLNNSDLRANNKRDLTYGLSHLVLRPKITASDGLTIYGQFNIFNGAYTPTLGGASNNQMGQVFGSGVGTGVATTSDATNSNTLSRNQRAESLVVSQLYITYNQEYGQLIAGRAPIQFGLGMTHDAGMGLFDHFYDSSDLVGYKIVMGNLYFLPMFGKPSEGNINASDDVNDYMIQVQYENPDTDLEMGLFYQLRKAGDQGSDAPLGTANGEVLGGAGSSRSTSVNTKTLNIFAQRSSEQFRLGMEAAFMSGESGVQTASGDKVTWNGFGIAGEFEYRPEASKWNWRLKTGTATGDDPDSPAKFEGFIFNQNYDVAMLMFNHPMGQEDLLRSKLVAGNPRSGGYVNQPDVEAISNVLYLAPGAKYAMSDKWSLNNTLITGWLGTNPVSGRQVAKSLGYEWDLALNYSPRKGIEWVNQVGVMLPGSAWTVDGLYDNKTSFGFVSKAAISF